MDKVAFLPFGLLVDKWRWGVFSGEITPAGYKQGWNDLRLQYQGIVPPAARTEADFDPGAKYHVPASMPYTRYFLARILQFQFYQAACEQAGWTGPLHRCSFYGNKEVGQRLNAMLAMGASQALAGRARGLHRHPRDVGRPDARLFPAADGLAPAAEQGPQMRLAGLTTYDRRRRLPLRVVSRERRGPPRSGGRLRVSQTHCYRRLTLPASRAPPSPVRTRRGADQLGVAFGLSRVGLGIQRLLARRCRLGRGDRSRQHLVDGLAGAGAVAPRQRPRPKHGAGHRGGSAAGDGGRRQRVSLDVLGQLQGRRFAFPIFGSVGIGSHGISPRFNSKKD